MANDRGSEHWSQVLAGLAADAEKAEAVLAAVAADRKPVALASLTGDAEAAATVSRLNRAEQDLRSHLATLRDAAEDAEGRRQAALAVEEVARAEARRVLLCAAAVRHDDLAAEVDRAARILAEALAAHGAHIPQMAALGLEVAMVNRLRNRTMMAGSLHLAGLGGADIGLRPCGPSFRESAQGWSRRMLANLLPEDRQPAPRPAVQMPEPVPDEITPEDAEDAEAAA